MSEILVVYFSTRYYFVIMGYFVAVNGKNTTSITFELNLQQKKTEKVKGSDCFPRVSLGRLCLSVRAR